jgi:hypothetical protein
MDGPKAASEGTVNSPARRKPKKPTQQATHSILTPCSFPFSDQWNLNRCSISRVNDKRGKRREDPRDCLRPRNTMQFQSWEEELGERVTVTFADVEVPHSR